MTFGLNLEAELDSVEGKKAEEIRKKRQRILDRWLGVPQRFREPPGAALLAQQRKQQQ